MFRKNGRYEERSSYIPFNVYTEYSEKIINLFSSCFSKVLNRSKKIEKHNVSPLVLRAESMLRAEKTQLETTFLKKQTIKKVKARKK